MSELTGQMTIQDGNSRDLMESLVQRFTDPAGTMAPSLDDALNAADDFLVGLLNNTGMRGYYDPEVGLVSTIFVIGMIRAYRSKAEASA